MDAKDIFAQLLLKLAVSIHAPVMDAKNLTTLTTDKESVSIHAPVMDANIGLVANAISPKFQSTRP
tara:strand:+ start:4453 stop:4650 length:198 start_codon:yes stop_codon:yes gene_type:complete